MDSNAVAKLTVNDRVYDLWHSSLRSFPQQFKDYIVQRINPELTDQQFKSLTYQDLNDNKNCNLHGYPALLQCNFSAAPTNGFLEVTRNSFSVETEPEKFKELYPIAVRWTNNKDLWLVERPPFRATITYRNSRSHTSVVKNYTFDIWVPWTLMMLSIDPERSNYVTWLYFNDGPLNSIDDVVIPCFYPNMYNDARMCLNQSSVQLQQHLAEVNKFDLRTIYNFVINDYMSGGWNYDLGIGVFDAIISKAAHKNPTDHSRKHLSSVYDDITKKYTYLQNSKKVLSFLKYFSHLSLEQVMNIVTASKKCHPFVISDIVNNCNASYVKYNKPNLLGIDYFYPDRYSETGALQGTTFNHLSYNYRIIIDRDYLDKVIVDRTIAKIKQIPDITEEDMQLQIQDAYNHSENFTNRLIEFLSDKNSSVMQDMQLEFMDYKGIKEFPFILVTEDTIEFIDSDMSSEYFISKITEKVSTNV